MEDHAMPLIRNGYAVSTRRGFLGGLFSALLALALFDTGAAAAQDVKANQTHREAYSGLHGRLRSHCEALRWRESGQTGSEAGGAGRGYCQEEWLCESRGV